MNCLFRLLSFVLIAKFVQSSDVDEYLDESRQQCSLKNNLLSCAKYRTLRYLTAIGNQYGIIGNETSSGPVRLVKLDRYHEEAPEIFSTARQLPGDSEFTKFLKFTQRQANYYLGTQGIMIDLPEGAEVIEKNTNEVEEGRGKKKKAAIVLMPLIILFKLFKIKLMVAMVLASLVFIKKAIMLGALILPSILQHLKHCSKSHVYHVPHHHEEVHEHDDFGGLSGGYYGGYSKDYERAYNAYVTKPKAR